MTKPSVAGERLKSFVERIEKLEEERTSLGADIREVYSEAKGSGFDVKIMRQVVRLRKMEPAERAEMDELLDLYQQALGMAGGSGLYAVGVEEAAALFNDGATVDEVADVLEIGRSEAGKLRQRAEKAGLLTIERGRGRPRNTASENVSKNSDAETLAAEEKVSGISERGDISTSTDHIDPETGEVLEEFVEAAPEPKPAPAAPVVADDWPEMPRALDRRPQALQ